ncbi:MAG: response regulator transcription factor, partial [Patescibacteria group bacterium]|nr:response regulator transcription factor [Patescibacteria group bacterium]
MKILVVEDDPVTAETVKNGLIAKGHTVDLATDGADGSFLAKSFDFDVIILDYGLPGKNGLEICSLVRAAGKTTPIIFLSQNDATETKVAALEHGADDYMTKPFELKELYARIAAVTRRPASIASATLSVDDLTLDPEHYVVRRGPEQIHMTRKEFSMLEYFMKNRGVVLSRAMLMEHIWTTDSN